MALTDEERSTLAEAGWTEQEQAEFSRAMATFRDGLGTKQQEAFGSILALAAGAARGDDVQGYLLILPIIVILIGNMPTSTQIPNYNLPPTQR